MRRPEYTSVFKDEINEYIDFKIENGYEELSFKTNLRNFDRFCVENSLNKKSFDEELADKWLKRKPDEKPTTHYSRINCVKNFLIFLRLKGLPVYVTRDIRFHPTEFKPHIYTPSETERYFWEVDHYQCLCSRRTEIELPVIFRILYSCGTRINETLGIRKCDVNLNKGTLLLNETKNKNQRMIVISDDLNNLLKQYADKCFYMYSENDYIFVNAAGRRMRGDTLDTIHREILSRAGIPYIGGNYGPRIHDWRSTFAVNSFRQMGDAGMDMYVCLPILSAYMGHKTIYATEQYLQLTLDHFPYLEEKMKNKMNRIFDGRIIYEDN